MSNIINPVLPKGGAELSVENVRGSKGSGNKFSDHLDRRINSKNEENQDQLSVRRREEQCSPVKKNDAPKAAEKARPDENEDVAKEQGDIDTLLLFLQDIQQVAQEKTLGPGEWSVALPDGEILADLAEQAGMSQADLSAMVEQFQAKSGELDLDSFFQSLIDHFTSFDANQAVVVPETEFPMLESLLAKMGLTPEQLETVSSQIMVGDGDIDLSFLAKALEELDIAPQSLQSVTLSPWEAEQLQALLEKAGVSLGSQLNLLPEQAFGQKVDLSFQRLQAFLKEAVGQAKADQPHLDLPHFLSSLDKVMTQASFKDQSVGFTPVVQESMGEAYQDLLKMYDQARIRFEEGLGAEDDQLQGDIQKWLDGVVATAAEKQGAKGEGKTGNKGLFADSTPIGENIGLASKEEFAVHRQDGMTTGQTSGDQVIAKADLPQPVRHFPVQQQQQIFNQLSLVVARGMKSGEQHMVLRLNPAELGEVKVDLTVRHEVVSVSFTMENSKVKETLEGSMEEFRHNMEQKGFSMSDINVFVGQDQNDQEPEQRFEMVLSGERLQSKNLDDIPGDVLYHIAHDDQYASQEDGVNLFV